MNAKPSFSLCQYEVAAHKQGKTVHPDVIV
jgi:hypothetical protein